MIDLSAIEQAHTRIAPHIHRTPVMRCQTLDQFSGASLCFKCENFQKIGAFKIRGAMNAVLGMDETQRSRGIATHSSGNHAQAIAFAARQTGSKAYIVMPNTSPKVKVDAVRGYGAAITFCEPNQAARESALQDILDKTGAEFVHPYNDYRVITGQATCAKELIEDAEHLDVLIAPVGGGGLMSGTALSAHFLAPHAVVYAGEPEGAADAVLSLRNGHIENAPYINTIADGLLTKLGDKTFPIIQQYVRDVLTVSDAEIMAALRLVYERMKIVIEPSCAVPLAAVLKYRSLFEGKQVGIILSGGNVDLEKLKFTEGQ